MQVQIHSLEIDDFCDEEYSLIGIHTTVEDYKLAYLLNSALQTNFIKAPFNLDFDKKENNASFTVFSYENSNLHHQWFLIANSYKEDKNTLNNRLLLSTETKKYLIPEKKNVDFFIKILGANDSFYMSEIIRKINQINQVITSYSIDYNFLKSKEFLIF